MNELSKHIKELELKASKFDDFEENFKPILNDIFILTEEIQKKLQEINPLFKVKFSSKTIRRKRGRREERVNLLYNELRVNDNLQITISDIEKKFDLSNTAATTISVELRKMQGIQTRLEGRQLFFYYYKPKIDKDNTEISPEIKVPTKFSFKS